MRILTGTNTSIYADLQGSSVTFPPITAVTFTAWRLGPYFVGHAPVCCGLLPRQPIPSDPGRQLSKSSTCELVQCPSGQHALELVMSGECSTLIVDFDLPGAQEVVRMAALLPPGQKPALLAVASRAWPGTGQAFQSGASRILYRPLDVEQLKDALKADRKAKKSNRRKSTRYEVKTLVYLEVRERKHFPESVSISASTGWRCRRPNRCR